MLPSIGRALDARVVQHLHTDDDVVQRTIDVIECARRSVWLSIWPGEIAAYESTHPRKEKRPQLFDLLADPREKKNVASDHPKVVARMVKAIDAWYEVTERHCVKVFQ